MKVLVFSEAAAGGVLSVISDQLKVISGDILNLEVDFVYSDRLETPKNISDLLPECNVHNLGIIREDDNYIYKMWKALRVDFPASNYDVIHLHSSISGFIGRLAYFNYRSKVIYTPHCYAFLAKERSGLNRILYLVAEFLLGRVGTTAACGDSELAISKRILSKSTLIRNGVDAPCISRTEPKFDLVTVGRVCNQKGIQSFERLINVPDLNMSHLWVGGPENEASNVNTSGWLSREDAIKLLASGKLYISTAEWEGLPIAPIEAQHLGIPVIGLNRPGVRDVIVHGETGYLCDDIDEIIVHCKRLLGDDDEYFTLSNNCREFALDTFSKNNYLLLAKLSLKVASSIIR
jgi:glycosyltransferase involved in cell wall biosynthesis